MEKTPHLIATYNLAPIIINGILTFLLVHNATLKPWTILWVKGCTVDTFQGCKAAPSTCLIARLFISAPSSEYNRFNFTNIHDTRGATLHPLKVHTACVGSTGLKFHPICSLNF